jgi:ABC-2 type transport system ATP-binding protein
VARDAVRVRERIGIVSSEERSFFRRLTGRENLDFFAALYHVPPRLAAGRIRDLLDRVGLREGADRPFSAYSTGMRQKLAIARGLLHEPQVLFLDEPTRALDPISAREVRALVTDHVVRELGRTVVLATNSMPEAEELCDRVALIQAGSLLAEGTVDELRRALHDGVRCELRLPEVPAELVGALEGLAGVLDVSRGHADGLCVLTLTLREEGPVLAAVLREAVERDADVYGFTTRRMSLEDIYLDRLSEPQGLVETA